jgi:hypothetical protein
VSWRLACGLLNFIVAIVVQDCFIEEVVVVGGDVINADEVGGVGILAVVTDVSA